MSAQNPLSEIWGQDQIAVIFKKPGFSGLIIRLPGDLASPSNQLRNRTILQSSESRKARWNDVKRHWIVPKAWFNRLIDKLLRLFGKVYVIGLVWEKKECARACWEAEKHLCECKCGGEFHGSKAESMNWHEVSDYFAVAWGERQLGCRLMQIKS